MSDAFEPGIYDITLKGVRLDRELVVAGSGIRILDVQCQTRTGHLITYDAGSVIVKPVPYTEGPSADLLRKAVRYLRTPATTVEDQAVRLEHLAEAAPLLAGLLEQIAAHNHCANCGEHDPSLHEDPALAAARALTGGRS